jgi:hypothetical protein
MHSRHPGIVAPAIAAARIAIALAAISGAVGMARIHLALSTQRIHVRYVAEASDADRLSVEREFRLASGFEREPGTWSYVPEKRSSDSIRALVSHPLVEDTHHIDRSAFRIVPNTAGLPIVLRASADAGWLPAISALLALVGVAGLWSSRREALTALRLVTVRVPTIVAALTAQPSALTRRVTLASIAAAVAVVLPLSVEGRPDEAMFVHLYEATSILAGDHPYRDFFEWGAPLPAFLSALAQWLFGYRLIGELFVQWALVIAGVVVAFHLGLRQAHSAASVLAVLPLTLFLIARTGHHFSKLFCIPVGIWLAWRYVDQPTTRRCAAMGLFTAVAFLFRHDYALWTGLASLLAIVLVRVIRPELRTGRSLATHCAVAGLTSVATLLPWLCVVSTSEGLPQYVMARAERFAYSRAAGTTNPYAALGQMNPVRQLRPVRLPPPEPGVLSFQWASDVDARRRRELERFYGLRDVTVPGASRPSYSIPNLYDLRLLSLREQIEGDAGFDWSLLDQAKRNLPSTQGVEMWLAQMTMLVPLMLIASGAVEARRAWLRSELATVRGIERLLAGLVLACVNQTLLREWAYFIIVAPTTASLGARFLALPRGPVLARSSYRRTLLARIVGGLGLVIAVTLTALTTYAAAASLQPLFEYSMSEKARHVSLAMQEWLAPDGYGRNTIYLYLRECTTPRDRLLFAGSTPYYAPYFTQRPMAGGHLDWSIGLRADSAREAESLELLKRQSVPFVVGRGADVLAEFRQYPRIREYLSTHFERIEGSDGSLLYDQRRPMVRRFGSDRKPCFR